MGIRIRRLGSNRLSDKYNIPIEIDSLFRDLAVFIASTGFCNIRIRQNRTDHHILPIFTSVREVLRFCSKRKRQETESTCGYTFQSLELAWRLSTQNLLRIGNLLWYHVEEQCFILYIQNGLSTGTEGLLVENEDDPSLESPFHLLSGSQPRKLSLDDFLREQIRRGKTSAHGLYLACSIVFPRHLRRYTLSRSHIANRFLKLRKQCIRG